MKAEFIKHTLEFKKPATTSRGSLTEKDSYYLILRDDNNPEIYGVGECTYLPGLSIDDPNSYEAQLQILCNRINEAGNADVDFDYDQFPSIEFGLEMAIMDLENGGRRILFDENEFVDGERDISINGLIWMDTAAEMAKQVDDLLAQNFKVLKLKIGGIDFVEELSVLRYIRTKHPASEVEIRLDANGSFPVESALALLNQLAEFDIHSIEQPIAPGQWEAMAELIKVSPIEIALDEELIGINTYEKKEELLKALRPHYIILKPSLLGGFAACEEWIELADEMHILGWITSALESNIALNAMAQWVVDLDLTRPQGLGTGSLFTNNIKSPLVVEEGFLRYDIDRDWDFSLFEN